MLLTNDITDAANRCNVRFVTVCAKFGTQVAYVYIDYICRSEEVISPDVF